jgi:hypothetical protein
MMNSRKIKTTAEPHYDAYYHGIQIEKAGEGISMAAFSILVSLAGIVGFWGLACLIAGLMNNGILGLAHNWLAAFLGH